MRRLRIPILVASLTLAALAAPAAAHTGLETSTPRADASVATPVDELVLRFHDPVRLAGPGVEVFDATGAPVRTTAQVSGDTVTVTPESPLGGGRYGVRWRVRAGDAHPIGGSYAFTVTGGAADVAAAADAPSTGQPGGRDAADGVAEPGAALDAALTADTARGLGMLDQVLRAMFYVAGLAAVGVLAFFVAAWDGPPREARSLTRLVARLAMLAGAITVAQVVVRSARAAGGWANVGSELSTTLSGTHLIGVSLRLIGAALLVIGAGTLRRSVRAHLHPIAGAAVDLPLARSRQVVAPRWSAVERARAGAVAVVGALLIVASFAAVGHAATAEPRAVATVAVLGHTAATALWGGGLLGLVATLELRRRADRPGHAGLVATRFSVLATVGVTLATVAGVALATVRLERVAELWTTAYGVALVGKVAVVMVVGALGAYNHFRVVPTLRRGAGVDGARHLRVVGLIELILLAVVAGLTSALVGLAG